jgi:hypothetical protein
MSKNYEALNDHQMVINGKNFINTTNKKLKQKVKFRISASDLETEKTSSNINDDIYQKYIYIDDDNSNSLYQGYDLGIIKICVNYIIFLVPISRECYYLSQHEKKSYKIERQMSISHSIISF